jgi:hypothetical protein
MKDPDMHHSTPPWPIKDGSTKRTRPNRPGSGRPAQPRPNSDPSLHTPRFLTATHIDPFWRRQAQILTDTWRAGPITPTIGITWDRGQVTGDATWKDILSSFSDRIACDPEHPDTALLQRLGEGLVALRRTCSDYRLDHLTTARLLETFLASVLFESEIRA